MVKLDLIIAHRLKTFLTYLPVAPDDLKHHFARYCARMESALFRFGKGLSDEEDRAHVAENLTRREIDIRWNLCGIVRLSESSHAFLKSLFPIWV
jgi:hypothetical protein